MLLQSSRETAQWMAGVNAGQPLVAGCQINILINCSSRDGDSVVLHVDRLVHNARLILDFREMINILQS